MVSLVANPNRSPLKQWLVTGSVILGTIGLVVTAIVYDYYYACVVWFLESNTNHYDPNKA